MITCPKCSKDNQDHYKFCLGCGAELPRDAAPKPFSPKTPPQGVPAAKPEEEKPAPAPAAPAPAAPAPAAPAPAAPAASAAPAPAPAAAAPRPAASAPAPAAPQAAPAAAAPAGDAVTCPQCGHGNTTANKFCASCGYNLSALQGGGAASAAPAAAPAVSARGVVLTALRADGTEAGNFPLPTDQPQITVGRDTGSIFAGDSYLSPRHATFTVSGGHLQIKDESSLNGVYIKLKPNAPHPLEYNDVFRIGQEIIRFEPLDTQGPASDGVQRLGSPSEGYIGRLALVIGRDTTGNAFPVPEAGVHCGRERGDILFSEDGYVSGLHCRIHRETDGVVYLTDVGSSNGTFARVKGDHVLQPGDVLLMGQQLFRVDM